MAKTLKARSRKAFPGDTALVLTAPWPHDAGTAPKGTVVQPLSAGNDSTGRHSRTVTIDGQAVTGPY